MAIETEYKFLVTDNSYKQMATHSRHIAQYYISDRPSSTVRVRIAGDKAWLTVKGLTTGCSRNEWEYGIPLEDARAIAAECAVSGLEKTRWYVPFGGHVWEVDEYAGHLQGLVIAEIEVPAEDTLFARPPFVGADVTGDPQYYNSALSRR